ncbi:xanthine dehydrogenase family protein subunit M [Actinoplanes sp. DH11]|uniref:FAD binding domain-containing protein n=1 Tax=Actinoplanes sp. DH11 TaxID=2857011 RepID=UPI001E563FA8|nr:FAD binding domain-containing protein [Actinoplanes sp. DH11]
MPVFQYLAATELDDVLVALADGETAVLAGGQSLILDLKTKDGLPQRVVDINRVRGLDTLAEVDGHLRVGPLVRHQTFESDVVGGPLGRLLRIVVCHIGHPPIRARGTMLGSFAYAHPAAEWPVVAVTLGAQMVLTSPRGTRTVPAEQFFTGPHTTVRRPDELLTEAWLPVLPARTGVGYAEDRRTTIYPQAAVMAAVTVTDGLISSAAVGLVNAGPCPTRAREAERLLIGNTFCDAAITAAAEAAAELDARFMAETNGSRPARMRAVRVLARRALSQARESV